MLEVLVGTFDALVFAAEVVLWLTASVISLLFSALGFLLDWAVAGTVLIVPAVGRLLEVVFFGSLQLLEVILQVFMTAGYILWSIIQAAMLYLAMLLTVLGQLCVKLFYAVGGLDWLMILEHIKGIQAWAVYAIIETISMVLGAVIYIFVGFFGLVASVLQFTWSIFILIAQQAFYFMQFILGEKLLSKETYEFLLFIGMVVSAVFVLYNLLMHCIRLYLRRKARKRQRQRMLWDEPNARQGRQLADTNEFLAPEPPRENTQGGGHGTEELQERVRRRNRMKNQLGNYMSEQELIEFLNTFQDNYSSVKDKGPVKKLEASRKAVDDNQKKANGSSDGRSSDSTVIHSRVQELEEELMKEKESKQCVVCLDSPRQMMMRPCNHYCVCEQCSKQLNRCPICTKRFSRMEKVYNV